MAGTGDVEMTAITSSESLEVTTRYTVPEFDTLISDLRWKLSRIPKPAGGEITITNEDTGDTLSFPEAMEDAKSQDGGKYKVEVFDSAYSTVFSAMVAI
mmetsp:Transcript_27662/g.49977  ORF Transcript_27662/g.49977 Transcript_27662/m.49977 type:complete len:99 (-) Transcript_27662:98-394(-)